MCSGTRLEPVHPESQAVHSNLSHSRTDVHLFCRETVATPFRFHQHRRLATHRTQRIPHTRTTHPDNQVLPFTAFEGHRPVHVLPSVHHPTTPLLHAPSE